jgi:uncharacterized protein (TIGR02996 family)
MNTITDITQLALLNAIIANPEDDAPRLIFADWLDENVVESCCFICDGLGGKIESVYGFKTDIIPCGNCHGTGRVSNGFAERAALIRCQIKHPRWFGDDTWMESANKNEDGYLDALSWLKSSHCKDEFAATQDGNWVWNKQRPDGIVGIVRRGFVDEIHCTLQQWLDHGKDIVREHPVTKVMATDKKPFQRLLCEKENRFAWWRHRVTSSIESPNIPSEVFCHLKDGTQSSWRGYELSEYAIEDLSRALLAWAKS